MNVNVTLMVENVIQIISRIMIQEDASAKGNIYIKKDYIWNPFTCSCQSGKYLASIIDNSVITCDEIIEEEIKTITTKFNEKNVIYKTKNIYILLIFILITVPLLTAVSIYYYLIKYRGKQKIFISI